MALTLTVVDSEDGTGIATISGSDPATTNRLYRLPWTGATGTLTPTLHGSRTGDGTIPITGAGYYAWHVTGTVSAAAAFADAYMPITDATVTSVQEQLTTAVQTRVRALNLSGITSDSVQVRWTLRRMGTVDPLPFVPIAPFGSNSFPNSQTNTDDIGYPIGIALLDKANGDFRAHYSRDTLWQQQLLSALRYQHLAGVPRIINVIPESVSAINAGALVDQDEIVALQVFRFIVRMTRG